VLEVPEDPLDKLTELVVDAPASEEVVEEEFEKELEAKLLSASAGRWRFTVVEKVMFGSLR